MSYVSSLCLRGVLFFRAVLPGIVLLPMLTSCAGISRLHANHVPAGALQLAQVVQVPTRPQLGKDVYEVLLASGFTDGEIKDRSVGAARVTCCAPPEKAVLILFYIPPDVPGIELGDLVEVRAGAEQREAKKGGRVNTVTRIRQKHSPALDRRLADGPCRWDPPDLDVNLWARVLYCDWMKEEGWAKSQSLLAPYWFK